jgi:hypothetical protein
MLTSAILTWCGASQAGDANAPVQAKPPESRKVSPQEARQREAARQQWEQFEARAKAGAEARRLATATRLTRMVPAHLIKQYDANGDGLIDPKEWRKYRQDVEQQRAARLQARGITDTNTPAGP